MATKFHEKHLNAYYSWSNMKRRCDNKNHKDYKNYGGRGISYDKSWKRFAGFYADMGDREKNLSLDRINNNKGYSKENCRWATRAVQNNNSRKNKLIEYNGLSLPLRSWSEKLGINRSTLAQRIYVYKWNISKCLSK